MISIAVRVRSRTERSARPCGGMRRVGSACGYTVVAATMKRDRIGVRRLADSLDLNYLRFVLAPSRQR
jgi:hypothetical protein